MPDVSGHKLLPPLSPRPAESHKGDYGSVLVVAGSRGLTGAAVMASRAALRAGAGLVTLACAEELNDIFEIKLTEVMTIALPGSPNGTIGIKALPELVSLHERFDVVLIGPGLGLNDQTRELVRGFVMACRRPVVIDADGLNALAGGVDALGAVASRCVITPHPGEMARLCARSVADVLADPPGVAVEFAGRFKAVVALKTHRSVVTDGETVYVNDTGNPGMASAGTGDVLAGMIAAFVGQGIESLSAAALGVYLHGLAGDLARDRKGEVSMIAGDVLDALPEAIMRYQKESGE